MAGSAITPLGEVSVAEVPYLFRDDAFDARLIADHVQVSEQMIRHWAAFARTGDPNAGDLPP